MRLILFLACISLIVRFVQLVFPVQSKRDFFLIYLASINYVSVYSYPRRFCLFINDIPRMSVRTRLRYRNPVKDQLKDDWFFLAKYLKKLLSRDKGSLINEPAAAKRCLVIIFF